MIITEKNDPTSRPYRLLGLISAVAAGDAAREDAAAELREANVDALDVLIDVAQATQKTHVRRARVRPSIPTDCRAPSAKRCHRTRPSSADTAVPTARDDLRTARQRPLQRHRSSSRLGPRPRGTARVRRPHGDGELVAAVVRFRASRTGRPGRGSSSRLGGWEVAAGVHGPARRKRALNDSELQRRVAGQ
jgi:hypothetical protein